MPEAQTLALFAAATLVLNATPGVDLLLTLTRTLQGGARAGLAAALGINAGCALHALAAALGLAALLAAAPLAFTLIQWAGAAYLLWLAIGLLQSAWRGAPSAGPEATAAAGPADLAADFRRGLWTNLLNPKVALFFVAFLPQFVPATASAKTAWMLGLGLWFVIQSSLFLAGVVLVAARLRPAATRPALARLSKAVGGALFVGLALRLVQQRMAAA